ncbi:MAG: hypothetical protein PHH14_07745 [Candidatus Margulisbacteria bacterium]|nr:hypothetical protein [Candidatus Margulisiibacteriota bacterium]
MEPERIKNILASVLFMAREPLDLVQLEEVTGVPQDQLVPVLEDMVRSMAGWGIQVF